MAENLCQLNKGGGGSSIGTKFGTPVNLHDYTGNNFYTTPCAGFIKSPSNSLVSIYGANATSSTDTHIDMANPVSNSEFAIFCPAGVKLLGLNGNATFIPLI